MNLLGLLLGSMTSQSSVGEVAGKTGLSEKQIKQLMLIAIPILFKFLTKNASSGKLMKLTAARSSTTSSARKRTR